MAARVWEVGVGEGEKMRGWVRGVGMQLDKAASINVLYHSRITTVDNN